MISYNLISAVSIVLVVNESHLNHQYVVVMDVLYYHRYHGDYNICFILHTVVLLDQLLRTRVEHPPITCHTELRSQSRYTD